MSDIKLPFDYMDKNAVATTSSLMFFVGLEEKGRLYRDCYYGAKTVEAEILKEFIGELDKLLEYLGD